MNISPIIRGLESDAAALTHCQPPTSTRTNHPLESRNQAQETSVTVVNDSEPNQSSYVNSATTTVPTSCATIMSVNVKGRLQHFLTDQDRTTIVRWIVENEMAHGEKGVMCLTVRNVPSHFRLEYNTNIVRASLFWHNLPTILARHKPNSHSNNLTVSTCTKSGVEKMNFKARKGRGRKRSA